MSHCLTQPEEIEFVLKTMEAPREDAAALQDGSSRYGSAELPCAAQSDPRGKGVSLT